MKKMVFFSRSGCLLPILILSNLFFGLLFFRPFTWLCIEAVLVLAFILNSLIFMRILQGQASQIRRKKSIDIEAEVLEK